MNTPTAIMLTTVATLDNTVRTQATTLAELYVHTNRLHTMESFYCALDVQSANATFHTAKRHMLDTIAVYGSGHKETRIAASEAVVSGNAAITLAATVISALVDALT